MADEKNKKAQKKQSPTETPVTPPIDDSGATGSADTTPTVDTPPVTPSDTSTPTTGDTGTPPSVDTTETTPPLPGDTTGKIGSEPLAKTLETSEESGKVENGGGEKPPVQVSSLKTEDLAKGLVLKLVRSPYRKEKGINGEYSPCQLQVFTADGRAVMNSDNNPVFFDEVEQDGGFTADQRKAIKTVSVLSVMNKSGKDEDLNKNASQNTSLAKAFSYAKGKYPNLIQINLPDVVEKKRKKENNKYVKDDKGNPVYEYIKRDEISFESLFGCFEKLETVATFTDEAHMEDSIKANDMELGQRFDSGHKGAVSAGLTDKGLSIFEKVTDSQIENLKERIELDDLSAISHPGMKGAKILNIAHRKPRAQKEPPTTGGGKDGKDKQSIINLTVNLYDQRTTEDNRVTNNYYGWGRGVGGGFRMGDINFGDMYNFLGQYANNYNQFGFGGGMPTGFGWPMIIGGGGNPYFNLNLNNNMYFNPMMMMYMQPMYQMFMNMMMLFVNGQGKGGEVPKPPVEYEYPDIKIEDVQETKQVKDPDAVANKMDLLEEPKRHFNWKKIGKWAAVGGAVLGGVAAYFLNPALGLMISGAQSFMPAISVLGGGAIGGAVTGGFSAWAGSWLERVGITKRGRRRACQVRMERTFERAERIGEKVKQTQEQIATLKDEYDTLKQQGVDNRYTRRLKKRIDRLKAKKQWHTKRFEKNSQAFVNKKEKLNKMEEPGYFKKFKWEPRKKGNIIGRLRRVPDDRAVSMAYKGDLQKLRDLNAQIANETDPKKKAELMNKKLAIYNKHEGREIDKIADIEDGQEKNVRDSYKTGDELLNRLANRADKLGLKTDGGTVDLAQQDNLARNQTTHKTTGQTRTVSALPAGCKKSRITVGGKVMEVVHKEGTLKYDKTTGTVSYLDEKGNVVENSSFFKDVFRKEVVKPNQTNQQNQQPKPQQNQNSQGQGMTP